MAQQFFHRSARRHYECNGAATSPMGHAAAIDIKRPAVTDGAKTLHYAARIYPDEYFT